MASNELNVRLHQYKPVKTEDSDRRAHTKYSSTSKRKAADFRSLRIVLIVLSALIVAFSLVELVMDCVILSNLFKYSGNERIKKEKEEQGGDQSMEGTNLSEWLLSFMFGISLGFSLYNLVTFLVCMVIAIAAPRLLLAAQRSSAVCLLITTMFGFLMSAYTPVLYFLKVTEVFQPPGGVGVVCSVCVLAYFIMQLAATCCFTCSENTQEY